MKKTIYIFCFMLIAGVALGQSRNIVWQNASMKAIQNLAKDKQKLILVDTYADWCRGCKQMDIEFKNPDLALYLNSYFVNVKVHMDRDKQNATLLKQKYQVVFLPTILILDHLGNVLYKTERQVPAQELLRAAINARKPKSYVAKEKEDGRKVITNTSAEEDEKVITTLGNTTDENILRKEAYFRLELMDGSHRETAEKYLASQKDWSSSQNMIFIMDFTEKTDSKQFKYIVNNKEQFYDQFGEERVDRLLNIVVYERLQNGFPRPSIDEARKLFGLIGSDDAYALAYNYYIKRLLFDKEFNDFVKTGKKYLDVRPGDVAIASLILSQVAAAPLTFEKHIPYAITLGKDLLAHNPSKSEWYIMLIEIYLHQKECDKASETFQNYVSNSNSSKADQEKFQGLLNECY